MPVPQYPLVNGHAVSYCSIRFAVGGIEIVGVLSINYKDAAEFGKFKGTARKNIGRSAPIGTYEGDIEFTHKDWKELLPILTLGGTVGYAETSHLLTVAYAEPSDPLATQLDSLIGTRFHSAERSNAEGTDIAKVKVMLDMMDIAHGAEGYRMISDKL